MRDMEQLHVGHPEAEQRAYARQLFSRLSPTAQSIFDWRWLGYSWREIGGKLEMDHSAVPVSYTHLDVYKRQNLRSVLEEMSLKRRDGLPK